MKNNFKNMEATRRRVASIFIISLVFLLSSCFKSNNEFPGVSTGGDEVTAVITGDGKITGKVYSLESGTPLENAVVSVYVNGTTYTTDSDVDGSFSIDSGIVERGSGYNVQFVLENYSNATRAAVFELPNLRVDLGIVNLTVDVSISRKIIGIVYDDFSDTPLTGANVSVMNSNSETINFITGADGAFDLTSDYFFIGSSYTVTITNSNYIINSSVVAVITGAENTVTGNPIHLYKNHGNITGVILDDNTGSFLTGATVEAIDGNGDTITDTTDADGKFQLVSQYFYMASTYTVNISKSDYISGSASVTIALSGDNTVTGSPIKLLADITVKGVVEKASDGTTPIAGVLVSILDSNGDTITDTTNSSGEYSFVRKPGIWKGVSYQLNFTEDSYYSNSDNTGATVPGDNIVNIEMASPASGGHVVSGTVRDFWDNSNLQASITLTDNTGTNSQTAGADGSFSIAGDFNCGGDYFLTASLTGYSGEVEIDKETMSVTIDCGGTSQSVGIIKLYPIGIRGNIAGITVTDYSSRIRQTYEKFLTGKIGITITANDVTDFNACSNFYLHIDETTNIPNPPEGVYSLTVAVNGSLVRGAIAHGIAGENSVRPSGQKPLTFGMNSFTYYHFHVSDSGLFTIETAGATDTYMYLYNSTGGLIAQNDDGGSGSNAKITSSLGTGWYFVKIKGYDDNKFGEYTMTVAGTVQNSGGIGTWTSNNLIISFYSHLNKKMYIAGESESGSSGTITLSKHNKIGELIRGTFSGTMREISSAGTTKGVTNGYFNVIRSQ